MPYPPPKPPQPSVDAQMATAKAQMQQEMPAQAGASVEPMGSFAKWVTPGAAAITNPFTGSIYYNPEQLKGQSQEDVNNVLAHEMTHTRQAQESPWYSKAATFLKELSFPKWDYPAFPGEPVKKDYQPNPIELEAFQTEHDRSLKRGIPQMGDINLYPSAIKGLKGAVK